jgi:hypothetical protein
MLTVEAEARVRGVKLVRGTVRDAIITGHALRLEQALVNLLDNAVKFNKTGGEARIEAGLAADGHVFISVSDTGQRHSLRRRAAHFRALSTGWTRLDRAKWAAPGWDFPSWHVVERMEGTIKVESRLGKGSTFTIVHSAGLGFSGCMKVNVEKAKWLASEPVSGPLPTSRWWRRGGRQLSCTGGRSRETGLTPESGWRRSCARCRSTTRPCT